jgi:hypothetical protein
MLVKFNVVIHRANGLAEDMETLPLTISEKGACLHSSTPQVEILQKCDGG